MFKKIVSRISFSPALVAQLGFYAKRLRKEQATRKLGLIFVALALVVQSLVVFQAPEPANAAHPSDMIYGGLGWNNPDINKFLAQFDRNENHLADTTSGYFGISRAEITAAKLGSFKVGTKVAYGYETRPQASPHYITNSNGFWVKTIYGRSMNQYYPMDKDIPAFIGHSKHQGWFAIMVECGNIVTNNPPKTPPIGKIKATKSAVNVTQGKVNATKTSAKANDRITYTISAGNTGSVAKEFTMTDNLSEVLKYATLTNTGGGKLNPTTGVLSWPKQWINAWGEMKKSYTVQMKSNIVSKTTSCSMKNTFVDQNVTIKVDCTPPPANIVASKKAINVTQGKVDATKVSAKEKNVISYTVSVQNTGGTAKDVTMVDDLTEVVQYATLTNPGGGVLNTTTNKLTWPSVSVAAGKTVSKTYTVTMKDSLISTADTCKMTNNFLDKEVTVKVGCSNLPPEMVSTKDATNVSQGNVKASTVTAQQSDRITFMIKVKNTGGKAGDFIFSDTIRDTLEYSTLIDNGGGTFDDKTKTLSWPKVSIAPGAEETRTFTVQILSKIPASPQGMSEAASYNCQLDNAFNEASTVIKVSCPAEKIIVEQPIKELPKTGAGTNMIFAGLVLAVAAFFYFRSRQLGTEVRLVRRNVNKGAF